MSMNIQKTITDLRKEKGYTQEKLAEMLGVTTAAVSKWECGNSYPDITLLPQLAEIFGVSLDYLFDYHTVSNNTISDVILQANHLSKNQNRDGAIALISRTLARHPNNDQLIFELARHKMIGARYKGRKERQAMLQDAETGFTVVAENTQNNNRRAWAYHFLTTIAIFHKDYERARSHNDHIIGGRGLYPKVERAIIGIREYDNENALHDSKEVMYESIVEYSLMVNWILNYHLLHNEADEAICEAKRAACILREFNENGLFDNDLSVIWEGLAWAYAKKDDYENTYFCLEEACIYAEKYDHQENGFVYNVYGIMKDSIEDEERISSRKNLYCALVSNERQEYDSIRNSTQFKSILEKLCKQT